MHIEQLILNHFRNLARLHLTLTTGPTIFYGDNGQGKSNLLEALYVLTMTRSFRARQDRELISWDAGKGGDFGTFTRISGHITRKLGTLRLEVIISLLDQNLKKATVRKQIHVNGIKRSPSESIGLFSSTLFTPDDVELIVGSPEIRRRFIDVMQSQVDRSYLRILSRYQRIVSQRNSLLKAIREGRARSDQLQFWDEEMASVGSQIVQTRAHVTSTLQKLLQERHDMLSPEAQPVTLCYQTSIPVTDAATSSVVDLHSALQRAHAVDITAGVCTLGPHRDDFLFTVAGKSLLVSGSRGQLRTATVALKLAEADFLTIHAQDRPVLLLDDVLSELDRRHRSLLLEVASTWDQVIITTTDLDPFPREFLDRSRLLRVHAGTVSDG